MNAPTGLFHRSTPTPCVVTLHREHKERLQRLGHSSPVPAKPDAAPPVNGVVFPAYVYAADLDTAEPEAALALIPVSPSRVREIQDLVCKNLGARRADLTSARRTRMMVIARQIAMYLCKQHTPNSLPDIGRRFGGRDHTTVLHAVSRVEMMVTAPWGTSISRQWSGDDCDFVRAAVLNAEVEIATWPEGRGRSRYPARSKG